MVIQKHKSSSVHFFLWLACDGALRVGPAHLTKGHSSPTLPITEGTGEGDSVFTRRRRHQEKDLGMHINYGKS